MILLLKVIVLTIKINKNKVIRLFYKNSELPIVEELIYIIKDIKNFEPDLILAVGGGAVIDYAKIANVTDVRPDLAELIINYYFSFRKRVPWIPVGITNWCYSDY